MKAFFEKSGVADEASFYAKYPTEKHFFDAHPDMAYMQNGGTKKKTGNPPIVLTPTQQYYAEKMFKQYGKVVLTDKATNLTIYGKKHPDGSWDLNQFEVLTGVSGKNANLQTINSLPLDQIEKLPRNKQDAQKITPIGIFKLIKNTYHDSPSYNLESTDIAYHKTYKGADNMNREKLYNNKNNTDNYRSYGCINCQKPSIEHLANFIGNTGMGMVIDSRLNPKQNDEWISKNTPQYVQKNNTVAVTKPITKPVVKGYGFADTPAPFPKGMQLIAPPFASSGKPTRQFQSPIPEPKTGNRMIPIAPSYAQSNKPVPQVKQLVNSGSIVDYMNSLGLDASKENRALIAKNMGIENYNYTAEQNTQMLQALREKRMGKGNDIASIYQVGGDFSEVSANIRRQTMDKKCPPGYGWDEATANCIKLTNNIQTIPNQKPNNIWEGLQPTIKTPITQTPPVNPYLTDVKPNPQYKPQEGVGVLNSGQIPILPPAPTPIANVNIPNLSPGYGTETSVNENTGNAPGTGDPTKKKKKKFNIPSTTNALMAMHGAESILSIFGNMAEEKRQKAWNDKQMADNFNQTYSNAGNDYGVDPYEQTGQTRSIYAKYGGKYQSGGLAWVEDEEETTTPTEASNEKKKATRVTEELVDDNGGEFSVDAILNGTSSFRKSFAKRHPNTEEEYTGQASNVSSTEALNTVKDYYLNKGYNPEFVAGVMGNIHAESSSNSNANEKGGSGFGLFQHTGARKTQLINWAVKNGLNPSDPLTQAKFAEQEPDFQKAHQKSKGKSPAEAAKIFEETFERPGIKRSGVRMRAANKFYQSFQTGGAVITNNPNDPHLKAYNDSLYNYNKFNLNGVRLDTPQKLKDNGWTDNDWSSYKKDVKNTYGEDPIGSYLDKSAIISDYISPHAPIFKKPTRRYIYQKPKPSLLPLSGKPISNPYINKQFPMGEMILNNNKSAIPIGDYKVGQNGQVSSFQSQKQSDAYVKALIDSGMVGTGAQQYHGLPQNKKGGLTKAQYDKERGLHSVDNSGDFDNITPNQARQILHNKEINGHPLTDEQRKLFGYLSKGNTMKFQAGGEYTIDFKTMMELKRRGIKFKILENV